MCFMSFLPSVVNLLIWPITVYKGEKVAITQYKHYWLHITINGATRSKGITQYTCIFINGYKVYMVSTVVFACLIHFIFI